MLLQIPSSISRTHVASPDCLPVYDVLIVPEVFGLVGAGAGAELDVVVGCGGMLVELGEVTTGFDGFVAAAEDDDEGLGAAGVVLPPWLEAAALELEAGLVEVVCCCWPDVT